MQSSNLPASEPVGADAVPRHTLVPSPDRRTDTAGHFGRTLTPNRFRWISIDPDGSLQNHETPNLGEFRDKPYRRWWQYLVDEAMSAHIDQGGTVDQYGGVLVWHQTPSLGYVLRAAPSEIDPTPRPHNPVAGRMLKLAMGTHAEFDHLVSGPAIWIGGYDFGLNFYLQFADVRLAGLLELHRVVAADALHGTP